MQTAAKVLGIIGGVFGIIFGIVGMFFGSAGAVFGAEGGGTLIGLGFCAVILAVVGIIGGILEAATKQPSIGTTV